LPLDSIRASGRLRSAARAERERLERELGRLDSRASALAGELAAIETKRQEFREQLVLLARLTAGADESPFVQRTENARRLRPVASGIETQPSAPIEMLRGARIREVAVPILLTSGRASRPILYGLSLELLHDAGYAIIGKDPAATFLTQVGRSPVIRRADRPGMYAVDLNAPGALQRKLSALSSKVMQLNAVNHPDADSLAATRQERDRVLAQLAQVEKDLEEALRALGAAAPTKVEVG
jgi:chromosome segregation ATPase